MQSRKSSILKPRKVREPLQDLNQLLPNNDDEETTTTDAQRRRVSFASMNKVKEYEAASECVAVLNTPPVYDKRYSLSTDLFQSAIPGKNTTDACQITNVSRKSVQNTFKINTTRSSIADENVYVEEDVELTETTGRIYDIPMKSSGDSSMEMTHVISQTKIKCDDLSEEIGPLNLTKENFNQTGSFADAHIVEIEIVDKNEKDADTSSMETTEVISNNIIKIENPDIETLSMETTEVITNNVIRIEKRDSVCSMDTMEMISSNFDKSTNDDSSMETTEVIYDNMLSESIKSQSVFYETLQSSQAIDDTTNANEEIEYVSIRNFKSQNALPKRKSIFEMSARPLTNWENAQVSHQSHEQSNFSCSSVKLISRDENKLVVCNDSLSLTCQGLGNKINDASANMRILSQEVEHRLNITNEADSSGDVPDEIKFNTSTQEINKMKYDALSLPLLSPETGKNKDDSRIMSDVQEKTKSNSSNMELLTQEDKTKCNSSSMVLTQEENKTKCNNSNMELQSQEGNKTKYTNSNMELLSQEDNGTKYNNSNMELLTQENQTKFSDSILKSSVLEDAKNIRDISSSQKAFEEENFKQFDASIPLLIQDKNEIAEKSFVGTIENEIAIPLKKDASYSITGLLDSSRIVVPEIDSLSECESVDQVAVTENVDLENISAQQPNKTDSNKLCDVNDKQHDTSLKSSQEDESSANDSNSPLTVDVNFSIFQKNKETRVEFCGTIDSNKKRKSISNVKVNIINNKTEKANKHVKELRFSMPATTKSSHESASKKPEFSATFTDFNISNKDFSPLPDNEVAVEKSDNERSSIAFHEPTESTNTIAVHSSEDTNGDKFNAPLAKPAKKRFSNDAFDNAGENEVSPKRRSLNNEMDNSQHHAEILPSMDIEGNTSSAPLIRCSFTEMKQRKESFIREEKSILTIDDMVVETCSRSTNMNVSYETRQMVTVSQHDDNSIGRMEPTEEQTNNQTMLSCASSDTSSKVNAAEPCAAETISQNFSTDQFSDGETGSRSQSIDRSLSREEEINDYSLHNPSIIVNIGDSFSHYKSMDLGTDNNVSASDICELVVDRNEAKPVIDYIDSDDISKENFIVEWLQNKTGKANADNRLFMSSSDNSTLLTVKSAARGSEKPSSTGNVRLPQKEGTQLRSLEIVTTKTDRLEDDEKKNFDANTGIESTDLCENVQVENRRGVESVIAEHMLGISSKVVVIPNPNVDEKMKMNLDENAANMIPEIENKPEKDENIISCEDIGEKDAILDVMKINSSQDANLFVVSGINDVHLRMSDDDNEMEVSSDENELNPVAVCEKPNQVTAAFCSSEAIPCEKEMKLPKSSSKIRQSVDPVFVRSELPSEKRQKMSPEFDQNKTEIKIQRNKIETEQIIETNGLPRNETESDQMKGRNGGQIQPAIQPRNIFKVFEREQCENKPMKKLDKHQHRHRKFEATRKDILEKIESSSKNGDQKWKMKVVSNNEWVFQFFYDQLELIIKFDNDESSNECNAVCRFVQPPYVKYYEISKIAIEYLIRKNETKLKKNCRTAEDVPYLLKLIEPDVIYIENFVIDIFRLCDTEVFKIKNGMAMFYIYSYKNIMSAKIQINLTRLEKLSVKDVHVEEIVGKTDLNLIRNILCEAGSDSDFISKFVKKLWIALNE